MPHVGKLKRGTTHTFEVTNATASTTAVTILMINRRDRITDADPTTVTGTTAATISVAVGDRIDRVIALVAPSPGGQVTIRVNQGASMNCDGDMQVTFDTEA